LNGSYNSHSLSRTHTLSLLYYTQRSDGPGKTMEEKRRLEAHLFLLFLGF
jgi:hypothetical protein